MPSAGLNTLKEIGRLPLINKYADPTLSSQDNSTYAEYRQRLMRPVDIFPVKFQVDLGTLSAALLETLPTCSELPVVVDFVKGIVEYNLKLAAIKLCEKPLSGLRIWTNNETQSTDGIQNSYKQNKIVETFNNVIDSASKANEFLRSVGGITDPTQPTPVQPLAAALLDSRHLSLPKIWENSTYEPQLDITTKLISPYGSTESFMKNIAKPLLYLTALMVPSTYDGVTYGQPANMYIRAYGITFMPLAFADSFQIVRGGTNGRVNWNKQPLELSVSMSFKPALPGFAAFLPPNVFNLNTGISTNLDNLLNGALNAFAACSGSGVSCNDPIGVLSDLTNDNTDGDLFEILAGAGTLKIPGVTSLGNIIQSLRPTPKELRSVPPSLLNYYTGGTVTNDTPLPNPAALQEQVFLDAANRLQEAGFAVSGDQLFDYASNFLPGLGNFDITSTV